MEVMKDEFKQTEVGIIPNDWDVETMGEIGEVLIGLTYSPSNVSEYGTLVLRSSNIQNGRLAFEDNVYVSMDLPPRVLVKQGDILICVRNGSRQLIGKCAIIDESAKDCAFGAFMSLYRSNFTELIFHQFQSDIIQRQINEVLGATINQITNKDLKGFKVPLPPTKAEQTAIAIALSDANALITSLEKLIAKKKAVKQGVMQKLLQPKEGWIAKKLGELAILKARIGWQGLTTAEYRDSGDYFLVTGTEIKDGFVDWESCHHVAFDRFKQDRNIQLRTNDILVTKDGTIGKVALVRELPKEATLNSGVFVIRPIEESFVPNFFYYILMSSQFNDFLKQLAAGSTISHLYQKDFVHFKFYLPRELEKQNQISEILMDIDRELLALQEKLSKQRQLKQGMMQNLLTGKIRLVKN